MRPKLARAPSEHLPVPVHAMRRHGQRIRLRRERPALARQPELTLDLFIVRAQVVIADGPVRTNAFRRIRAKVLAMKTRHHSEPRLCAAPYAHARFGNDKIVADVITRLRPHDLARIRLGVGQRVVPAEPLSRLENGDGQTLCRHPGRHECAGRTRPDDHDVEGRGVRM